MSGEPLLRVRGLRKSYRTRRTVLRRGELVRAVEDITFDIGCGETLALVGESGSGKTTVGLCLLALVPPTAGEAWFEGVNVFSISRAMLRQVRRRLQVVFQDSLTSLDPELTVNDIVAEGLDAFRLCRSRGERHDRMVRALEMVRLDPALAVRRPHELSGGQRQRVAIARALVLEPRLVICDEPTASLDVSVQAQIVNLLRQLQRELHVSYLFITHDLPLARHLAHRVAVMQHGRIVECGPVEQVLARPAHPHTRALVEAATIRPA